LLSALLKGPLFNAGSPPFPEVRSLSFLPEEPVYAADMTENKRTVERYMDGFRKTDHEQILSCLTDDVEWEIPGAFRIAGKEAFDRHIEDEAFTGKPAITVTRLTEEDDVVVAQGSVRAGRKDGGTLDLEFCDVFEMQDGKIRRLVSYLVPIQG
jgi:ketosteroid isomerase-like protein